MKEDDNEFVLYEPTKSVSYGHQAREKNARRAWAQIEDFLQKWTIAKLHESISLQCVPPYDGPVKVYNEFRAHINRTLGTEGEGLWHFSPEDLPRALALAFDEEKWPRQQGDGPAYLRFTYDFEWATPILPAASPLRRGSSFTITVSGKRIFIQPTLIFPWPIDSGIIQKFLSDIGPDAPIQLREGYFKRMIPTKNGEHRVLRIAKDRLVLGPGIVLS